MIEVGIGCQRHIEVAEDRRYLGMRHPACKDRVMKHVSCAEVGFQLVAERPIADKDQAEIWIPADEPV